MPPGQQPRRPALSVKHLEGSVRPKGKGAGGKGEEGDTKWKRGRGTKWKKGEGEIEKKGEKGRERMKADVTRSKN